MLEGRGQNMLFFFLFLQISFLSMSMEEHCGTPLHTHTHRILACQSTHKCNLFFFFSVTVAHNASNAFKGSLWFHQGGWKNLKKLLFSEEKKTLPS
uniref:Putative secreted protein n=1 Tax=Ixodes ricinus TaxID=34613 RepID=A0A6B0U3X6_IXORI